MLYGTAAPVEPAPISSPLPDGPPSDDAARTAHGELPPLPAPPSSLLGRAPSSPAPSLTADQRAGPAFDGLVNLAVEGARREGSGRAAAWGVAVVLGAVLALRVIFDDALPRLLIVSVIGAAAVTVVALVCQAVVEARRQRALLEVLSQLARVSQHDAAMRERVAPQLEAVVEALRAPAAVLPFARPRK